MPTAYSLRAPPSASQQRLRLPLPPPPPPLPFCPGGGAARRRRGVGVASASASPFDELHARGRPVHGPSKKSMLWNLIQDIEPLDLSVIQKDVAPETVDAMKRTISGMLGLLPSDQFRVIVEALWNPFFKLLVSSIMTGLSEEDMPQDPGKTDEASSYENMGEELGDLTPQAEEYIIQMQSHLNAMKKELHDLRRKNSALQMQQFVGEEKNDLLDYLRSLTPEKVAELSESTSPGVQETIHSVVHGLLATLSPKVHSKAPPPLDNISGGVLNLGGEDDDRAELVENASLPFQPLISVPRDYLARLLFWCMLLGHYIRGLEYRLELARLLRISSVGSFSGGDDHVV
ncbi:hypothetical protein ZEAMMB73_Zm00001d033366 [Zea mays]|uniref:Uncharacterized protein n=1 Tax=Zea mays TaxID=4577 RepID=A0A1D6KY97_MAIZE|nr:hypothetical protein ZEAMMB73_Zm00001d033366 [Zea mays]